MSDQPLSEPQRRFAQEHHARAGERAAGDERLVFMYRRDERGTHRWLIDDAGQVYDSAWFAERRSVAV
jgi:hypothetical protein